MSYSKINEPFCSLSNEKVQLHYLYIIFTDVISHKRSCQINYAKILLHEIVFAVSHCSRPCVNDAWVKNNEVERNF